MEHEQMEQVFRHVRLIVGYMKSDLTGEEVAELGHWLKQGSNLTLFNEVTHTIELNILLKELNSKEDNKRIAGRKLKRKLFPAAKYSKSY